jgi:tRNA1(Val) A37 N6-methylase TrmN6
MDEVPAVACHGQVMTRPHIVSLILDLVGYGAGAAVASTRLLEPGCGDGQFLVEAAARLLGASRGRPSESELLASLLGIEKDEALVTVARRRLHRVLVNHGYSAAVSTRIARSWVRTGDFMRMNLPPVFDLVVGNPPYVRQEAIPKPDLVHYRESLRCFFDRADLYLAFIERGLTLLSDRGVLGFICPNRFTLNRYGSKLRALITEQFRLMYVIDLAQASPFVPAVMAYPGIYVIGRGRTEGVGFFHMKTASPEECDAIRAAAGKRTGSDGNRVRCHHYDSWFSGEEPWVTESPAHLDLVRRLEANHPTLGSDASGTTVGIGVASGADRVFIVNGAFDGVEQELLVPIALTRDCLTGTLQWSGHFIINPFKDERGGELIDLNAYPKARRYFAKHRAILSGRNVGKRNPANWYRTIDRIYPSMVRRPKLMIPDIKASSGIVFDPGTVYPHHNLYYITSPYWDLRALRTILRSSMARFFVWAYGVRMRSDFLRFQAQYLRRIPIPSLLSVSDRQAARLVALDDASDLEAIDDEIGLLYQLSDREKELIASALGRRAESDEATQPGGLGQAVEELAVMQSGIRL